MASLDFLEAEIDEIKKQLSYLTKTSNSSSSTGGETGGSQPVQNDDWVTLYDCSSEDANINLGYPNGIKGSTGIIANFPDLMQYKRLKIYFQSNLDCGIFYYDISELSTSNTYTIFFVSRQLSIFYCMYFLILIRDNKRVIHFGNCKEIVLSTSKHTTITDLKTEETYYIKKIFAK